MIKNDITYEYRVFTNRLIDVEAMEVGKCTSKVIKELKAKDKVDGRFFHTSDTDEWFFCWGGELQKLNLKGNADVNDALAEVKKLIGEASAAVDDAKAIVKEAKAAAAEANTAANAASAAVGKIDSKADKSYVDTLVADKADASIVVALSTKVDSKADSATVDELSNKVDSIKLDDYALKSDIPSLDGYVTESFIGEEIAKIDKEKQDIISDLDEIRTNANKGATALQEVPVEYITEDELEGKGYLTASVADLRYAPIGSEGVDLSDYAKKDFVTDEISKSVPKKVSELDNDANYLTEQSLDGYAKTEDIPSLDNVAMKSDIPSLDGYVKEESLPNFDEFAKSEDIPSLDNVAMKSDIPSLDGYAKTEDIPSLDNVAMKSDIPSLDGYAKTEDIPSMDNYLTKEEIDDLISVAISDAIGKAEEITNTILGE